MGLDEPPQELVDGSTFTVEPYCVARWSVFSDEL
jgi:hypothetical protein